MLIAVCSLILEKTGNMIPYTSQTPSINDINLSKNGFEKGDGMNK